MRAVVLVIFGFISMNSYSQVERIKSESRSNSNSSSSSSDRESTGFSFFLDLLLNAEGNNLERTPRIQKPKVNSLELMFQGATQPSSYFFLWPRIRASSGFFATDFRMNYLIEDNIEGYKHIRTSDWQIIQLNLISGQHATLRLGTGFMNEAFEHQEYFNEWTFLFGMHSADQTKMGLFEYRVALDWETEAIPRREFSVQYQHKLFSLGSIDGNLSVGLVFQRYYSAVNVWGIQAGIVFRLLKIVDRGNTNYPYQ